MPDEQEPIISDEDTEEEEDDETELPEESDTADENLFPDAE
jgi:hypothetical protein